MRALFHLASFFPHPRGATYSALRLAQALRARGAEVGFVVEKLDASWARGGSYDGFPVRSFHLNQPGKRGKLAGLAAWAAWLRRENFDLYHVHAGNYMNLLAARLAQALTGRPALMKITSAGWDTPDGVAADKWGGLALRLYRRLDAVVAMSSGQAETCRQWRIPGRIRVIPNGVDPAVHRPATPAEQAERRRPFGLPAGAPVLAYIGWLGHGKGTDVLFQTWLRLRREFPATCLLLAGNYMGERNLEKDLGAFLAEHGVDPACLRDPQLKIAGTTDDTPAVLQAADLFLFPSRREGFGTVQVEAMACGLPCLVNELPGVSCDIFPTEETGFRIAGNDVDAFVARAAALLRDPAARARVGAAARARAEAVFSMDAVAGQYLDLYRDLLGAKAAP